MLIVGISAKVRCTPFNHTSHPLLNFGKNWQNFVTMICLPIGSKDKEKMAEK
ncbi:MAG: hypothetical protein O9332_12910 [Microcystis sp. LE19-10.1B]|nr:hypothetical protein [Microcystis sp. LE19-10.1B]MDJ0605448.1 hypothetical protein [Microcystis sp. M53602_WE12]